MHLNIDFLGIEIDKKYIKIANEKIKLRYRYNKQQQ